MGRSKLKSLYTDEESKAIGWDEELIEEYPTPEQFEAALGPPNRGQLIRWHRFLIEPSNGEQIEMVARLIERLTETCPQSGN